MVGTADLIQGVNQCILVLGFERNVEIDGGVSSGVTQVHPVLWDRIPRVLRLHVVPT